jgi:flagellar biogenesis protein FliO
VEDVAQALAVLAVLITLGASLYVLRSRGVVRFALQAKLGSGTRRLQSLERLPLTAQHSLHLVKVSGRELLIAVSPSGCSVLDSAARGTGSDEVGLLR